jgi:hypothetical protein
MDATQKQTEEGAAIEAGAVRRFGHAHVFGLHILGTLVLFE